MKTKSKQLFYCLISAFVITSVLGLLSFGATGDGVRNNVLRMHVVANSDSTEDQLLKLKVRDAVLEAGSSYFNGTVTAGDAEKVLLGHRQELIDAAKEVVEKEGYDYPVDVIIGKQYFSTRTYEGGITLPAGKYEAVNVIIGEGKGHNWWCVMFPPMCLPAAESRREIEDVLNNNELALVKSSPQYEPRFKIIEFFEKFIKKF